MIFFQKIKKSDTVLSGLFCIIDFAELEYLIRNVPDGEEYRNSLKGETHQLLRYEMRPAEIEVLDGYEEACLETKIRDTAAYYLFCCAWCPGHSGRDNQTAQQFLSSDSVIAYRGYYFVFPFYTVHNL